MLRPLHDLQRMYGIPRMWTIDYSLMRRKKCANLTLQRFHTAPADIGRAYDLHF